MEQRKLGSNGPAVSAIGLGCYGHVRSLWNCRPQGKHRSFAPRFQGGNLDKNLALVEALRGIADAKGLNVAQLAIVWVLSRGKDVIPLIGARKRTQLQDAFNALEISFTSAELERIEAAVPPEAVAGTRYAADQMGILGVL